MRLLAALLLLAGAAFAQVPSVTPGASNRLLLKGHVVRPSGPIAGEVLVVGNTIRCAAVSCSEAAGATIIDTQGIIFPGLIDAHNHAAFNMFDEADWNPGPIYRNHNQWPRNDKRYPQIMAAKKHLESSAGADLGCEMDKYGEIKALIAGTTSVLLAPKLTVKACFGSLARTIDTPYNDIDGATPSRRAFRFRARAGPRAFVAPSTPALPRPTSSTSVRAWTRPPARSSIRSHVEPADVFCARKPRSSTGQPSGTLSFAKWR